MAGALQALWQREISKRIVFGLLLMAVTIGALALGFWTFAGLVLLVGLLLLREWWLIARAFDPPRPGRAVLGGLLIAACAASVLFIDARYGAMPMLWALALVWATDIGAYLVGRRVGGPKFAPRISPNKTWSGVLGGVLFALLMSAIWWFATPDALPPETLAKHLAISFGASVGAVLGDLFESHSKRLARVKDAGRLIPGHGGVLDRLDGALFALPFVAGSLLLGTLLEQLP